MQGLVARVLYCDRVEDRVKYQLARYALGIADSTAACIMSSPSFSWCNMLGGYLIYMDRDFQDQRTAVLNYLGCPNIGSSRTTLICRIASWCLPVGCEGTESTLCSKKSHPGCMEDARERRKPGWRLPQADFLEAVLKWSLECRMFMRIHGCERKGEKLRLACPSLGPAGQELWIKHGL